MRTLKLILLFHLPYFLSSQSLGFALEQLESQTFIEKGLNGKGVKIGIIDGGFLDANESISLAAHFKEDRVAYYKDFVTPSHPPYSGTKTLHDNHGTEVWELIGGFHPEKKIQYGLATHSTYYLARTDHDAYEKREEEKYLIQAMDEMITRGVKLFNISLGYTDGYVSKKENYTPSQIDGHSTWITHSLDSLLAIHDVLVILAAGNDGDAQWKILSAPADSKNVIAVGATKLTLWEEMKYSSIGPEWLQYVKPDVSSFSNIGTSYSAPTITGLAACLMQYDSTLKPAELKELLTKSSHLYPYPNNYIGYGVPSLPKLLDLLQGNDLVPMKEYKAKGDRIAIKLDLIDEEILSKGKVVVYHKSGWKVIKKETIKGSTKLSIERPQGCNQSTILAGKLGMEILWER